MKKIIEIFVELLFPKQCLGCNQTNTWLCQQCLSAIRLNNGKEAIFRASPPLVISQILVAADYSQPILKKVLHRYKYNFVVELGEILGLLLIRFLSVSNQPFDFDLLIPVPLAPKRLRWREFNQSEVLAHCLSQEFSWSLGKDIISRQQYHRPQVGLSASQRQKNIHNAFKLDKQDLIKDKKILLIDDVITTGSTIDECAKLLIQAGAREVQALVIAQN